MDKRINEHFVGNVKTTRNKRPFKLIHVELCESRSEARKVEKYFKSGFGREIIHEVAEVAEWQTRRSQKPIRP